MTSKLQNILHWILVIALTVEAVTPAIYQLINSGHLTGADLVNGIVGLLLAAATKFVYYANTVKGTTVTTSVLSSVGSDLTPQATILTQTTDIPSNTSVTTVQPVSDPSVSAGNQVE